MPADQNDKRLGDPSAAARRRSIEFLVASLSAAGVVLYVFLRIPFAIFYGKLGTSPEEVGLGYVQLLAQSSVLVAAIAGVAALACVSAVLFLVDMYAFMFRTLFGNLLPDLNMPSPPQIRLMGSNRQELAALGDVLFSSKVEKARQKWENSFWRIDIENDLTAVVRLRELDRMSHLSDDEKREQKKLNRKLTVGLTSIAYKWRHYRHALPFTFGYFCVAIVVLGLPQLAAEEGDKARECRQVDTLPGFDYGGQPVEVHKSQTLERAFLDRDLQLLGGDSNRYIFFDCRNQQAMRLPASDYVVLNKK